MCATQRRGDPGVQADGHPLGGNPEIARITFGETGSSSPGSAWREASALRSPGGASVWTAHPNATTRGDKKISRTSTRERLGARFRPAGDERRRSVEAREKNPDNGGVALRVYGAAAFMPGRVRRVISTPLVQSGFVT